MCNLTFRLFWVGIYYRQKLVHVYSIRVSFFCLPSGFSFPSLSSLRNNQTPVTSRFSEFVHRKQHWYDYYVSFNSFQTIALQIIVSFQSYLPRFPPVIRQTWSPKWAPIKADQMGFSPFHQSLKTHSFFNQCSNLSSLSIVLDMGLDFYKRKRNHIPCKSSGFLFPSFWCNYGKE